MPKNLDAETRNIIFYGASVTIAIVCVASLYTQLVVLPRLRAESERRKNKNKNSTSNNNNNNNNRNNSSNDNGDDDDDDGADRPPLLFLGCIASLLVMFAATAVITLPFVYFGKNGPHPIFGSNGGAANLGKELSSSINFCEEDFVDSDYIAEPANTISSLTSYCPLALLGMYGPPRKEWASHMAGQKRFVVAYITLLGIGVGSTTLHALLTAGAQGGDELPMLWFMACLAFIAIDIIVKGLYNQTTLIPTKALTNQRWLHKTVSFSAILATAVYTLSRENFVTFWLIFFFYCWIAIVGIFTIVFFLKWNDDVHFRAYVLLPLSVCTGWAAIFAEVAWLSELTLCVDAISGEYGDTVAPFVWNRMVHPFWHCSSALLAWLLIQLLLAGQGMQRGWGEPRLRWFLAPYVTFHKPKSALH